MKKFLIIIAVITFLFGSFCIYKAFDKNMNYDKSEYHWYTDHQRESDFMVEYIVQSNFFTGYCVLGIGSYMIAIICITGMAIVKNLDNDEVKCKNSKSVSDDINVPDFIDSNSGKRVQSKVDNTHPSNIYNDTQLSYDNLGNIRPSSPQYYPPYNQPTQWNQLTPQKTLIPINQTSSVDKNNQIPSRISLDEINSQNK